MAITSPAKSRLEIPAPVPRWRRVLSEHRPFAIALIAAAVVRMVVQITFMPTFIHSDGPTYLSIVGHLAPNPTRPIGYVVFLLEPLLSVANNVVLVAIAQHLLGLVTAVVLYAVLLRWGVAKRHATIATLPVLFDTLQLNLEHSVLSDTLFAFLTLSGLAVLSWNRQVGRPRAAIAGIVLGLAVTVRLVGEPLIIAGLGYCLLAAAADWRRRVVTALIFAAGFSIPVGAYATWYHHDNGSYALDDFEGTTLYLRSTSFVDCTHLSIPAYQRVLCPDEPPGERQDPTYYAFHDPATIPSLQPPAGVSKDEAMRQFAFAAIQARPVAYAETVTRDFLLNFDIWRGDRFGYETAYKWSFGHYVRVQPTDWTGPAYLAHGGRELHVIEPLGYLLALYGWTVYTPGPILFGCLVLALVAGFGYRRARYSGMRSVVLLYALTAAGLLLVPAATAEFVWRYQLPALTLLPAAAALAYRALGAPTSPERQQQRAATDRTAA